MAEYYVVDGELEWLFDLEAATPEEAIQQAKKILVDESEQIINEEEAEWPCTLEEDFSYVDEMMIVSVQSRLPIAKWREEIWSWYNKKNKNIEISHKEEEFEKVKARYFQLKKELEYADPSISPDDG